MPAMRSFLRPVACGSRGSSTWRHATSCKHNFACSVWLQPERLAVCTLLFVGAMHDAPYGIEQQQTARLAATCGHKTCCSQRGRRKMVVAAYCKLRVQNAAVLRVENATVFQQTRRSWHVRACVRRTLTALTNSVESHALISPARGMCGALGNMSRSSGRMGPLGPPAKQSAHVSFKAWQGMAMGCIFRRLSDDDELHELNCSAFLFPQQESGRAASWAVASCSMARVFVG
jgi:hypothetical protein